MDSYPPSSKIHIQFPQRGNMRPVEMIWYDGGIKPKARLNYYPMKQMGEWDGGIIFEGTKGKLMAGLFGRKPTCSNQKNEGKRIFPIKISFC